MDGLSDPADVSDKTVDGVGRVVDLTCRPVGLQERVEASDDVTFPRLALGFVVARMGILDRVVERVVRRCLRIFGTTMNNKNRLQKEAWK
ncbi:unnamed protein product, partial [Nesidiocoris tenuis]